MPQRIIQKVLDSHPMLRHAADGPRRSLSESAVVRHVDAGQLLVGEGQRNGRVWFVHQGLLHATIQSKNGTPVTVDVLRPGDAFGYLACWAGGVHLEDVSGLVRAQVVGLNAARFAEYIESHKPAAKAMLHDAAERRQALMRLRAISTEPATLRVRSVLSFLCDKLGPSIPMTRPMIATVAGLTTETVSRAMAPLSRRRVIELRRGAVEILDGASL